MGGRRIISESAENRGNSCHRSDGSSMTNVRARTPAEVHEAELRLPDAAAQTRIVSVARIRLDPGNLSDLSKGYFATTFLSSSPTTSATQWVSMHPFCLELVTTSARAALRLKAGRQPLCQRRHTHHISGEQSFTPTSAGFSVSNRILYQFDVERHEDASRHGEALERIESSGQHCLVRERALKALIDQPKLEAAKQVLDD
jgi:hypothetical protein